MASRRTSPALGPLDDDDLLAEILLRLPPKPSSLPRASLVCKGWRSIATDAAFRRRFRTHHRNRKPPILGVFEECYTELKLTPLLGPPDRIPSARFSLDLSADSASTWSVLGCRHGRVLLLDPWANVLLVFEPVSGGTHRIPVPPEFVLNGSTDAGAHAAVYSAAGGDHDHTVPFKLVLVGAGGNDAPVSIARVYSQESGMWEDLVSSAQPFAGDVTYHPSTLSGNALYWCLDGTGDAPGGILKFDLDNHNLTVISSRPPAAAHVSSQIQIIRAEDGGLGLAILSYPTFQLWDCILDCHGVATWVMRKTVSMDTMLGRKAGYAHIAGYAEDADAIVFSIYEAPHRCDIDPPVQVLFILHLESMKVEKHRGSFHKLDCHPFTNFYTAGTARA